MAAPAARYHSKEMEPLPRLLILTGVALVTAGIALWVAIRTGLGRLPGDIAFDRGNVHVAFPIMTSIIVSIVLTVVLNVVVRVWR